MVHSTKRRTAAADADDFDASSSSPSARRAAKKLKPASSLLGGFEAVFESDGREDDGVAKLPMRQHASRYHRPLLLSSHGGVVALLEWYARVCAHRNMPWRATFIDASAYDDEAALRTARKTRAYQVWISEIMLQQTRVETVRQYWLDWMAKWPSIEDLASAPEADVLAAWRGLGYYSRATRIHTAAKQVVAHPTLRGLLPETPAELEKHVAGVGPYTAGAISSIVFGHAVPILDGNVARVLSRQLAIYANPKPKVYTDVLWAAARVLVQKAADEARGKRNVPGEWNQALMELGATVCTPQKPACGECPIQSTCRAYKEATVATAQVGEAPVVDIEDLCRLCEPLPSVESIDVEPEADTTATTDRAVKKLRQATLSFGLPKREDAPQAKGQGRGKAGEAMARVHAHVTQFPMKATKQKIREESCLVCIVRRSGSAGVEYLLEQRPPTGLLASMWQFPSLTLTTTASGPTSEPEPAVTSTSPASNIDRFVSSLLRIPAKTVAAAQRYEVGSIAHVFSHLHLTMHVYAISLPAPTSPAPTTARTNASSHQTEPRAKNSNFGSSFASTAPRRWAAPHEVDAETMGTGMRNCWLALQSHPSNTPAKPASKPAARAKPTKRPR